MAWPLKENDLIEIVPKGPKVAQITPGGFRVLLTNFRSTMIDQLFIEFLAANETEGLGVLTKLPDFEKLSPTLLRFWGGGKWMYLSRRHARHWHFIPCLDPGNVSSKVVRPRKKYGFREP